MAMQYYRFEDGSICATSHPELYSGSKQHTRLSAAKGKELYKAQQADILEQDILKAVERDGDAGEIIDESVTVYAVIRSVAASGMSRVIDFYVMVNNQPQCISFNVGVVLGWKMHKDRGIIVSGCGMDMVYHTVDSVWRSLGLMDRVNFHTRVL
jgi:hypothetical protein